MVEDAKDTVTWISKFGKVKKKMLKVVDEKSLTLNFPEGSAVLMWMHKSYSEEQQKPWWNITARPSLWELPRVARAVEMVQLVKHLPREHRKRIQTPRALI